MNTANKIPQKLRTEKYNIVRQHLNKAAVKLLPIAEDLGVQVFRAHDWPDTLSGMIKRNQNGGFDIFLNADHSENRRRFTLAHELAHLILHEDLIGDGIVDDAMYRSGFSSSIEAEANNLAADILMPVDLLHEKIKELGTKDIDALARTFEVSKDAMRVRLQRIRPDMIYDD